jgi:hypothetical protein
MLGSTGGERDGHWKASCERAKTPVKVVRKDAGLWRIGRSSGPAAASDSAQLPFYGETGAGGRSPRCVSPADAGAVRLVNNGHALMQLPHQGANGVCAFARGIELEIVLEIHQGRPDAIQPMVHQSSVPQL